MIGGEIYQLTMEDNFDGDDINPDYWVRCPETPRATEADFGMTI